MVIKHIARQMASFQIGILNTGIRHNHPDLAANINGALSHDWADDTAVWTDRQGHGTLIAGAANAIVDNGLGAGGIVPKCRSVSLKIASDTGGTISYPEIAAVLCALSSSGLI